MKLLERLRRSHRPDVDALSALADGRLDAPTARELEAHVAGCDSCAESLAGVREVKSILSAMREVEAPRSFRLRRADIQAARRAAAQSSPLRWAPALSGAAAALFVAVLVADVSTRGDDGDGATGAGSLAASRVEEQTDAFSGVADLPASAEAATAADQAPGGAIAPTDSDDGADSGGEASVAPPQALCDEFRKGLSTPDAGFRNYDYARCAPENNLDLARDANATREAELEATRAEGASDGDGGGNRVGFLVVQIIAAAIAVAAAVTFFATRGRLRSR